jgi:hypothetical protein
MPKYLSKPLVLVAAQTIDRLDITGYVLDIATRTVTLKIDAVRVAGETILEYPDHVLEETTMNAVMAAATVQIVTTALAALGTAPAVIAGVKAAMEAQPDQAKNLYYLATRDQLYAVLPDPTLGA